MTVSDILLKVLADYGVRYLFGIPGDAINDITDALRRQSAITFIGVRHEEAGAFAASAQAKLTGQLCACMGTSGPGAIHLLNGLYDARLDHAPVVAITGQIARGFIGTEYHQEVRLERLFSDVAGYSQTVVSEAQVPGVFVEACHAAIANRGVAHISIPTDVSGLRISVSDKKASHSASKGRNMPAVAECEQAVEMLNAAHKPLILAGIGCANGRTELIRFAEKIGAPIIRTLKAKEVIDIGHPLCIGGLGLLGEHAAVKAIAETDLLVMAGTDFPYQDFYPENTKSIQIDVDATRIGKRYPADAGLVGQVIPTLEKLTSLIKGEKSPAFLKAMQKAANSDLQKYQKMETSTDRPIKPARVARAVADVAPEDAIFLADTGTVTAWTARHLRLREGQRFALSGGLASMAFGLPAAIGAQLAYPERRIFALVGDGAFSMLMGDFVTAVRYELPIIVVVFNNEKLGFIELEQAAKGLPHWGTEITNPDFSAVARACGGLGWAVEDPEQLISVLDEALSAKRPAVIDVKVNPEELVMPPKIEFSQVANFGLATVREFFSS